MMRSLRRLRLPLLTLGAFSLLTCTSDGPPESDTSEEARRPRVLLLTIDTLRSDYLSVFGYDRPTTPALDALLADGIRFPNTLTPVPRTTPALASLLTGAYPHTTGVRTLYDRLSPNVTSLAESLQSEGFRTVAVVSNHVLTRERGLDRGFDLWDAADDARDAAATTEAALRHLDDARRDEKIFLWVHYIDPHVPYFPPREIVEEFAPGYEGRYPRNFGQIRGGVGDAAYPPDLPKAVAVYQNPLADEVNVHIRRLYAADIRATDDAVADLLDGLRSRPAADWLTVFTADHGESLGEHPEFFYDHGDYVDQGSLRVPLAFVLPPGDPLARSHQENGSKSIETWVSLVDIAPTLWELLDLEIPPQTEGRSLVPFLRGEELPSTPVFAESGRSFYPQLVKRRVSFDIPGRFRTVIQGSEKLVWTPGADDASAWELYDLREDPDGVRNLYRPDDPRVAPLQDQLFQWLRSAPETSAEERQDELSEEDRQRLRSLGYLQ